MIATTDDTHEIVTDGNPIQVMDSDGNVYSFELTEAELLQNAASNPGSGHDEALYGDKGDAPAGDLDGAGTGDNDVPKANALEHYEGDSEIVADGNPIQVMDSDGNVYSFKLTEAQLLQNAASNPGSGHDRELYGDKGDAPAGDLDSAGTGDSDVPKANALEHYEGDGEIVADGNPIQVMDSDGNVYSFELTEAELLQNAASNPGSGHDGELYGDKGDAPTGNLDGAAMALAALTDAYFIDMIF